MTNLLRPLFQTASRPRGLSVAETLLLLLLATVTISTIGIIALASRSWAGGSFPAADSLDVWLERSQPFWPEVMLEEGSEATYEQNTSWARGADSVSVSNVRFHSPILGGELGESEWACLNRAWKPTGECEGTDLNSRFVAGRDTFLFTRGSGELYHVLPCMYWRTRAGDWRSATMPPLSDSNVAAIWYSGRFVVFGLELRWECGGDERLAIWDLESGRWSYTPRRDRFLRRLDPLHVDRFVPEWRDAEVGETGGAAILRTREKTLAFWPSRRTWAEIDERTGKAVPGRRSNRRVDE